MKALIFSFVLIITTSIGFSNPTTVELASCPAPANLAIVAQAHNSISFDWEDCGCSFPEYHVFYVKDGQTSPGYDTRISEISFSSLSTGTYQFHFYTSCGANSSIIIIEDVVMG